VPDETEIHENLELQRQGSAAGDPIKEAEASACKKIL